MQQLPLCQRVQGYGNSNFDIRQKLAYLHHVPRKLPFIAEQKKGEGRGRGLQAPTDSHNNPVPSYKYMALPEPSRIKIIGKIWFDCLLVLIWASRLVIL